MIDIAKKIMQRRGLIWELALKNLKIRYCRPYLGFFWAFLSPLSTALIYYVVFFKIFKFRIEGMPFFLYLMSAIFPWSFFHGSLVCSVSSLMDNRNLIRESKFPHHLIIVAILVENIIVFLPPLLIIIVSSLILLKGLSIFLIFLPLILAIHTIITFGLSLVFSILYLRWRDVRYILDMVLLFLFNFTPAFYSVEVIRNALPAYLFKLYLANPFVCILNLYRIALLKGFYGDTRNGPGIAQCSIIVIGFAFLVLLLAIYLYRKNKNTINDYLSY